MRRRIVIVLLSFTVMILLALGHVSADPSFPPAVAPDSSSIPPARPRVLGGPRPAITLPALSPGQGEVRSSIANASGLNSLLYFDDFSRPNSGWATQSTDPGSFKLGYDLDKEEYFIQINVSRYQVYSPAPWGAFENFAFEVQGRPTNNIHVDWGIIFGVIPVDCFCRFYYFAVAPNGRYSLWLLRENPSEPFTQLVGWTDSPVIRQGTAINTLRVERDGASIRLFANGTFLNSVTNTTYMGPVTIALYGAVPEETAKMEFRFDNARLYSLHHFYLPLFAKIKAD
ncbi:MAG: hypothetical protein A2Z04_07635 [Chloroflexi bacterium RBG_16_57_9]|nr:MAG: hypothetical protein A2Z04_07635 [Chloroflexi bacterium RBG_16_57_9]